MIKELKSNMRAVGGVKVKPNAVYLMPKINMNAKALSSVGQAMAAEDPEVETAMLIVKGPGAKKMVAQIQAELEARKNALDAS